MPATSQIHNDSISRASAGHRFLCVAESKNLTIGDQPNPTRAAAGLRLPRAYAAEKVANFSTSSFTLDGDWPMKHMIFFLLHRHHLRRSIDPSSLTF